MWREQVDRRGKENVEGKTEGISNWEEETDPGGMCRDVK